MSFFDPAFKPFGEAVKREISYIPRTVKDYTEFQKGQVEALYEAEKEFRRLMIDLGFATQAYEEFVRHITEDRKNLLAARPFFRERQGRFDELISDALRSRDLQKLEIFDFNWQFIKLVMSLSDLASSKPMLDAQEAVRKARDELIVSNLPMAISRARMFARKMPESHLGFMDFIQVAGEGLISAVDKYVLPYSTVFRSVIIGRVNGNHIREYSDTPFHFYPSDSKKLYRANRALKTFDPNDYEKLAEEVNRGLKSNRTNPSELMHILAAASIVSTDSFAPSMDEDGNHEPTVNTYAADDSWRPDVRVEEANLYTALHSAISSELSFFYRKLLAMKGVDLEQY